MQSDADASLTIVYRGARNHYHIRNTTLTDAMAENLTGNLCCDCGLRDCNHCCQSVFCAPCVYAGALEKAQGDTAPPDTRCMPIPQTSSGVLACSLMVLVENLAPLIGIFGIRMSRSVNQDLISAAAAECCAPCLCYGNVCHMNAYRLGLEHNTGNMGKEGLL